MLRVIGQTAKSVGQKVNDVGQHPIVRYTRLKQISLKKRLRMHDKPQERVVTTITEAKPQWEWEEMLEGVTNHLQKDGKDWCPNIGMDGSYWNKYPGWFIVINCLVLFGCYSWYDHNMNAKVSSKVAAKIRLDRAQAKKIEIDEKQQEERLEQLKQLKQLQQLQLLQPADRWTTNYEASQASEG